MLARGALWVVSGLLLLCVVRCRLFVACSLFAGRCLQYAACCSLFAVCCLLFAV